MSKSEVALQLETTEEILSAWESGSNSPVPPQLVKKLVAIYNVDELVEKIEFRWNECSTLPPSIHPETEKPYFWKNQGVIAECPEWILDLMRESPVVELPKKTSKKNTIYIGDVEKSLVDILETEIFPRLDATEFYGNWVALKPSGKNFKSLCPFHQEKTGSFTVSPENLTYHCFGCGAGGGPVQFLHQIKGGSGSPMGKKFAEVVRELADRVGVRMPEFQPKTQNLKSKIPHLQGLQASNNGDRPAQARKPKVKKKEYPPAPIPAGAQILRLPAPGQSPRAERPRYFPQDVPSNATQTPYIYSNTQKVLRFEWPDATNPKGHIKTYRQVHTDFNGKQIWSKGDIRWPAYQINEVIKALATIPDGVPVAVLMLEGEPNVHLANNHSIAALTLQGSNWSHPEIVMMLEKLRATGKNVVLAKLRDNDDAGIKKGNEVWLVARHIQFPCVIIDPRKIYPDIPTKGDIREILEAIGPDELLNRVNAEIAAQAVEPLDTPETVSFEPALRQTQLVRRWKKLRKYTATVRCNSEYVMLAEPGPNTITCIKAGLGRGKTQWLTETIAAVSLGKMFLLGHRNALLRGTSKRCGFYHIIFDDGRIMLKDPNGRVASCVDSLLKFPDDSADENCTIILDEVESVIRHILGGGTIKTSDRIAILEKFRRLLNSCSRIILLDGHLTDRTVAYIAGVAPGKAITKYENTFKAALPKVEIFKGSGAPFKASQVEAFKDLILKSERPAVFCDSKDDAIALYKQLEEIHGEGTGLLLTADNATEDLQADFMDVPDESIRTQQWKFIVATPLLQDGVDISIPEYFSEVFGIFGGVVSVNSVYQMVRRVRHPIGNIKILCAERGYQSTDGGQIFAAQIQKLLADRMAAEISEFDSRPATEIYAELCDELKACPHHAAWFDLKILENLEQPHHYDFVCELLRESGHEVLELDLDTPETKKHSQVKEEVKEAEAEAVASAEIITIAEAEKILSRQGNNTKVTQADIRAANRAVIVEQLPGIEISKDLVLRLKKERTLLSGMRNLWNFQNPEKTKQLRGYRWEEGRMKVFGSDHKKNSLILRELAKLDIQKFLDSDRTFCNDSPEILAVAKWGKSKEAITAGLKIKNEQPIQYLQSLLVYLGIRLVSTKPKGEKRRYSYKPQGGSLPTDFSELFAAISSKMLQKWEEKVEKKEAEKRSTVTPETIASISLEVVPPLPIISIDRVGGGGSRFEDNLPATEPLPEPAPEPTESQAAEFNFPEPIMRMGWVQRWGKWVRASFLEVAGTQYRMLIGEVGNLTETLAWPDKIRWDDAAI